MFETKGINSVSYFSEERCNRKGNRYFNSRLLLVFGFVLSLVQITRAENFTPSDVFSQVNYANQLAMDLLKEKGVSHYDLPLSRETQVQPMHVYELHVSVLAEIYSYALSQGYRPPPIVVARPMSYKPTDVYYLSLLAVKKLEEIHKDKLGFSDAQLKEFKNKSPTMVYQEIFALFYRLNLLNGQAKISPSIVFSHVTRMKEDLQTTLLLLSRRLEQTPANERTKRLLTTATFGTHPEGTHLANKLDGKNPSDVLLVAF